LRLVLIFYLSLFKKFTTKFKRLNAGYLSYRPVAFLVYVAYITSNIETRL
ncbi:unnamed protein product, partial [marine sediment metagenome]